jgi:hypothetical protein
LVFNCDFKKKFDNNGFSADPQGTKSLAEICFFPYAEKMKLLLDVLTQCRTRVNLDEHGSQWKSSVHQHEEETDILIDVVHFGRGFWYVLKGHLSDSYFAAISCCKSVNI